MATLDERWAALVAGGKARWMPGMRGFRIGEPGGSDRIMDESEALLPNDDLRPDFTDPATLGCLLGLVESGCEVAWTEPSPTIGWFCFWGMMCTPDKSSAYGASKVEALIAALEAAP